MTAASIEGKHNWLPSAQQIGETSYSGVRSIRGLPIGPAVGSVRQAMIEMENPKLENEIQTGPNNQNSETNVQNGFYSDFDIRISCFIIDGGRMVKGKKIIAIGERDGVPGPVIAECLAGAGYEVVFQVTECFV
jgi:glycine/sarcosine/betaine reductase complex component A